MQPTANTDGMRADLRDFLALVEGLPDDEVEHALAAARIAARHLDQQKNTPLPATRQPCSRLDADRRRSCGED